MRNLLPSFATLALGICLWVGPAFAHEEHCHLKGTEGKLTDDPDLKTKKACDAKSGTWFHHHQHCHKADPTGKMIDVKGAKDPRGCTAKGGTWTEHGHDQTEKPAGTK